MKILILAGGEGVRLWPLSRKSSPKQLQSLFQSQTLLEQTLARIRQGFSNKDIYISTLAKYYPAIKQKTHGIPKENYIIEPVRRDRGPAIGLAATLIHKRHPNTVIATAWADNFIPEVPRYLRALRAAEAVVKRHPDFTVMLGIKPRYPATTLGYIQKGKLLGKVGSFSYYLSKEFAEKPSLRTAKKLIQGGYVWNPGIFVWNTGYLLSLYEQFSSHNFALLQKIAKHATSGSLQKIINQIYPRLRAEEVENALLEKTQAKILIPVNFTWADIGTYRSLVDILGKPKINLTYGLVKHFGSTDNFIYEALSHKLVLGINLKNLVIVDTKDALLVTDKLAADELKIFLNKLKKDSKLHKYL